jgi:competence protein ComEA
MMKEFTRSLLAATMAAALLLAPPAFAAEPLDLNQATPAELATLDGIGPVYAQRIVDYRSEHGPFESVDQLVEIKGIGEKTLAAIKDEIAVGK